jgi:quinolinate synthase
VTATLPLPTAPSWTPDQWEGWREELRRLARQRDSVLLPHSYQAPETRDVADHRSASKVRTLATAGAA